MRLTTTLFVLSASYASLSAAQSTATSNIFTIQPVTSIIPSSLVSTPPPLTGTRTSTRIGGSQVEPTSFTTSRRTISDASTDRPPPSISSQSGTLTISGSSLTATSSSPATTVPVASSASSAAASATSAAPNAAAKVPMGISAGILGILAALGGAILV